MKRPFGLLALAIVALLGARAGAAGPVRVGAKPFTESVVLGQVAAQLLASAGVDVAAVPPTEAVWDALVHGDVDVYPEYTGTLAQTVFHDGSLRTVAQLRAALAAKGIGASDELGFNDTYAIGMAEGRAAALGVRTISDLRGHPGLRFGFTSDFLARPGDGWPSVRAAYGLPQADVRGMEHAVAYQGLAGGVLDATELYSTDAEIKANHLRVLADDRHFFPDYQAVYLYRLQAASAEPRLVATLARLAGRISADRMAGMNAAARLDHVPEAAVAGRFLAETLGVQSSAAVRAAQAAPAPVWRRVLPNVWEHLWLVGWSLAAAVAVGVPLGVVAAEFPRAGWGVLGAVAGIYTVPSLALLVLMVPLFGIGQRPAVVALFLYSLLPIVRNTQAGVRGISPSLRESAEVLGLSRRARLWRIELPLATPSMVAGIKTAAVLNVGTATLGALIGAGGLGEPIFTGVRLNDQALYLTAAAYAAGLALLIQGAFEFAEPLFVPRGLRLGRGKPAAGTAG